VISNFFMYIALVDCHADLFVANATHDRARVKDYKQSNIRKGYLACLQSRAPHQSQSRKPKSPNNHNQLKMPRVQRPARSLVVFGKERGMERENPFNRKKGFSLSMKFSSFSKLYSSQSLGKNKFN
jgi:hypothetical protein